MQISKKCQYALRAVFELALRNTRQPMKIHDIASAQNIPARFLEVILNQLRHSGFVDSRRGSDGGYMLARDAENLAVGEIIECIQGPISLTTGNDGKVNRVKSFFGDYAFEQLWQKVNIAVLEICENTTFAELVECEMSRKSACVINYAI